MASAKKRLMVLLGGAFALTQLSAQMRYGDRPSPYRTHSRERYDYSDFKRSLIFSVGYGYPNLDKDYFIRFDSYYLGSGKQSGPIHAALDYQFNPSSSIGLMVAYGKWTVPYYNYNGAATDPAAFYGKLQSWALMINFMRYMQGGRLITPYLRTAIGINLWDQSYLDQSGNKIIDPGNPNMLAYQAGIGARINFTEHAGLFLEAGYGKYIVSGGLSYKF